MALITFLSLYDFTVIDDPGLDIPHLDKLVHFVFYFVGTMLGCFFLRERINPLLSMPKTFAIVASFMVLYGLIIELMQAYFTKARSGELTDFAANFAGVIFGLLAVRFLFSPKTGLNWKY